MLALIKAGLEWIREIKLLPTSDKSKPIVLPRTVKRSSKRPQGLRCGGGGGGAWFVR